LRWIGASLVVAAIVIVGGGVLWLKAKPVDGGAYENHVGATPVDQSLDLTAGTYTVFEETGTERPDGSYDFTREPTVALAGVTVTGPGDAVLRVEEAQYETLGGFESVARVEVPSNGLYRVQIATANGATAPEMVVARGRLGELLEMLFVFALFVVAGLVLGAVGLVVVAAGFTRRGTGLPVRAAPGWYPDPAEPDRWRYWDGMAWTAVAPAGGLPAAREP
jgi:hypothetical protein